MMSSTAINPMGLNNLIAAPALSAQLSTPRLQNPTHQFFHKFSSCKIKTLALNNSEGAEITTSSSSSSSRVIQEQQHQSSPAAGSLSSTRTQLDLLEQLTSTSSSSTAEGNFGSDGSSGKLTIGDQLAKLGIGGDDDFSIPLGKNLKKVSAKFLTISQKRNIKRQAYLEKVSQRNDSVFFATIGAFVILPPFIILALAILTGYVQLFP